MHARIPIRGVAKVAAGLLLLCLPAFGLAACGGSPSATATKTTSGARSITSTDGHPRGLSAVNAPMQVRYGTGSIGAPDPTTTLPNEGGSGAGQAIQPDLNPGQNIIIRSNAVEPSTLEANVTLPVVWFNLSGHPQRIIFNNFKYFPVDSGTIPPGGTFSWTPPDSAPFSYTVEPSGAYGKVDENPANP